MFWKKDRQKLHEISIRVELMYKQMTKDVYAKSVTPKFNIGEKALFNCSYPDTYLNYFNDGINEVTIVDFWVELFNGYLGYMYKVSVVSDNSQTRNIREPNLISMVNIYKAK